MQSVSAFKKPFFLNKRCYIYNVTRGCLSGFCKKWESSLSQEKVTMRNSFHSNRRGDKGGTISQRACKMLTKLILCFQWCSLTMGYLQQCSHSLAAPSPRDTCNSYMTQWTLLGKTANVSAGTPAKKTERTSVSSWQGHYLRYWHWHHALTLFQ